MNLHSIVRNVIQPVNADQMFLRFRSAGYKMKGDGNRVQFYEYPAKLMAQVQQPQGMSDTHNNGVTTATMVRKLWVFSPKSEVSRPWSMLRPLARSGDYLRDDFGNFWLVNSVEEDFSSEGWISLLATMTVDVPDALKEFAHDCKTL